MTDKILSYPDALCNQIKRLAIEAGEKTLEYFDESGVAALDPKSDGSPVTQADRDAEALIEKALKQITPSVLMVGEEATEAGRVPDITGQDYFWLVDALDGTKEFIAGDGDFTVNIALIHKGEPVLGVVYAPFYGEMYSGFGPGTAARWLEDTNNEKEIRVRKPPREGMNVMISKHHDDPAARDAFLESFKVNKLIKRGSSLKICTVAVGKADMYPRFGQTSEWDTAAADAILRSAGGVLIDFNGTPLRYGKADDKFINPHFIATSNQFDLFPQPEAEP